MSANECYDVPDNRPCVACGVGRSEYRKFNFARGVRCLCATCCNLGYTFDPVGNVLDKRGRVVGERVTL